MDDVERYFSFQRIDKWNKAKKIVKLQKDFNITSSDQTAPVDKFLADPENEESKIDAIREQVWGKDKKGKPFNPRHWTNKSLEERVNLLNNKDIAEIYNSSYYLCNFFVHSMYHDIFNNAETVHLLNWHCYNLTNKMFLKATELVNEITEILPVKDLGDKFKDIEAETFKYFFGEMVGAV